MRTKAISEAYLKLANCIRASGFVQQDSIADLSGVLSYSGTSQSAISPGFYTLTPQGLNSQNYTIEFRDGRLTILPDNIVDAIFLGSCFNWQHSTTNTGYANLSGQICNSPSVSVKATSIKIRL